MKKGTWIFIVSATALVFAVCCTNAKAVEDNSNKNDASLRVAQRLFEMKMYEQAQKILLELKESEPTNLKVRELLAKVTVALQKSGVAAKAKPVDEKVLSTVVKEVDFTDARLDEIVTYLSAKCEVNIVFSEEAKKPLSQGAAAMSDSFEKALAPDEGVEGAAGGEFPVLEEQAKPEVRDLGGITIRLKDVPLKAVLKYVLQMKGLTYIVEDYAIVIVPRGYVPEEDMETHIYKLYSGASGASPRIGSEY